MDYRGELLALMDGFREARPLSEARVANLAGRDSRFFSRLREGKGCSVDTLLKTRAWFDENWPDGAHWPRDVPRPAEARP